MDRDDHDNDISNDDDNDIDIEEVKQELLADDESDPSYSDNYAVNRENSKNDNIRDYQDLDPGIQDRDYVEFVINVIKKTVKQEDSLVRQIFYSTVSAYTNDPINLGIIAPTSEGKTYPVIESLKPFPKEDVWLIGSMSNNCL